MTKALEFLNDNKRWLVLAFTSILISSLGILIHNAFADNVTNTIQTNVPTYIAVNPNTDRIYVLSSPNTISVIDGSTNSIIDTIGIGGNIAGDRLDVNSKTNMIYALDDSTIIVINGTNDKAVTNISLGTSDPQFAVLKVNPVTNVVYEGDEGWEMAGPYSSVYVINGTSNTIVTKFSYSNPSSIEVNSIANRYYVSSESITVYDGTTNNSVATISTPSHVYDMTFDSNTNKLYALGSSLYVIDTTSNTVINTILVGNNSLTSVAVNAVTNKIYAASSGTLYIIDGSTNSVIQTIQLNSTADVGVNSITNKIYVANPNSNTVTVIDGSSTVSNTPTVPSAPQNLTATASSTSQINLSWTAPNNNGGSTITGYNIYRGITSGGEGSTPIATGVTSTSYADTAATNGQTYFYKVTAVNSVGESSQSNEASATPTMPATSPQPPTGLTAISTSTSQINLRWTTPSNNGGSEMTGYDIERSTDNGSTWSTVQSNTGSTATTYSDTGLASSTTYTYRVSAINSVGTSQPSNTASATTSTVAPPPPTGIVLNNILSTSGTTSSSNQIILSNFNAGTGNNRLLVVGITANNNNAASVTFNGIPLKQTASSFYNNDAEFWYLKNPTSTGNIVVTMAGQTQTVVGAYSFANVNQTVPIPTHVAKHNTTPNSPNISLTTKFANDWVLDLPSIYGGSTLGSPTCTQQWDVNMSDAITGASSSKIMPTPGAITCKWTASSADFWDNVAIEIKASN